MDDGVRGWGVELRADNRRGGGGGRSRGLKEERPNPNGNIEGEGEIGGETHETTAVNAHGSYAESVHGESGTHACNKGKALLVGVGPEDHNNTIPVADINSRIIVALSASRATSHVGPHNEQMGVDAQVDKKRRREGGLFPSEEALHMGYVTVVNNPLANTNNEEESQHFLRAGPGSQACQDQ